MTESFREDYTCWVNGFIAEQSSIYSIRLRLLRLFVANPNAFFRLIVIVTFSRSVPRPQRVDKRVALE